MSGSITMHSTSPHDGAFMDPLAGARHVFHNLSAGELVEHALLQGGAHLSDGGALMVDTAEHTGRSVRDKFIVDEPASTSDIWWGEVNQPMAPAHFQNLRARAEDHLRGGVVYVQDVFAGADPQYRIAVRLVTDSAWHALFARNMFIRPTPQEHEGFAPHYTIIHAPGLQAVPAQDGTHGGTAIVLSLEQKSIVIVGTRYAGEIKKAVFTLMNWLLPQHGVLPMHCSANIGEGGDVAVFFGLSGTGKTTLSSDPSRRLIGDDEHGWSAHGIFNFEGGCYAKAIGLDRDREPAIWRASTCFGAILENVASQDGVIDFDDGSRTENTRSCYPIEFIDHIQPDGCGGIARHVVMLTADAFGVLPPLSRLTPQQAMYHFMTGYTAKVAGTEKGLGATPQATFSTCFGAPFLPRPPEVYGAMLRSLIEEHGVACWLVNTGWTGGPCSTGQRMSLAHTRRLLNAALGGELDAAGFEEDGYFGLLIPTEVQGVPSGILRPRQAWDDARAYARAAGELLDMFAKNDELKRKAAARDL
ncbi:phosphoenolpyruvate carboxykinase (ATP) [Novacetimonas maltaceti]|uniref:Phosphoenolpyruvate carboxykinase (ATP) n=1 Tax=Novacetimonas maltaceti TaxID=1203393 RepID=A0A2S3W2V9_9PROT|nr:Phosphoenolpyruvate carboxykinase [Novacetimonas maltaceti]PYD60041.1 phosphoenolpyruvate carboxykinase (ATP) [Novacetimonas maltaceti]